MKKFVNFPCAFALVIVVLSATATLADIYDRCVLVDDNTVIVKLKGGVSIKLVRKGQDIFLQQKSADDGRWLSSIDDPNAFRMIMKFVKMGRFSGCRRRLFAPRKQAVIHKKPRKLFRNAWFF
ncbi:unnamed protein product [Orchesella dallaii]|uniref:Uncharacterized protein n=1 Tax=Orchesella dallaii TaxID=48710 RepID=A0ABP1S6V9_9HEXA